MLSAGKASAFMLKDVKLWIILQNVRNFIINIVYIIIIAGLFYLFMKYAFGVLSPFI